MQLPENLVATLEPMMGVPEGKIPLAFQQRLEQNGTFQHQE